MMQQRNIFISYLVLIISSISLLCVFQLNNRENVRVSNVLNTVSFRHLMLQKTLSEQLQAMCFESDINRKNLNSEIQKEKPTEWKNTTTQALPETQSGENNNHCQKIKKISIELNEVSKKEQEEIKSVVHNLSMLSYLNPILLLIIPLSFAIWRTGGYIRLVRERKNLYIDPLTGVYNRHYLYEETKNNKPSHLIMLDLDNFKQINDNYGHLIGDRILVAFSRLLRHALRSTDRIVRFGGDEFIIMLYDFKPEDAESLIKRLRFMSRQYIKIDEHNILLLPEFSAGLVEYSETLEETISRADAFVYQEKYVHQHNT